MRLAKMVITTKINLQEITFGKTQILNRIMEKYLLPCFKISAILEIQTVMSQPVFKKMPQNPCIHP